MTPAFKVAYQAFLKKGGAARDPILCGQDVSKGAVRWVGSSNTTKDEYVRMWFRCGENRAGPRIEIIVKWGSGTWRVDGTEDLRNR